MTDNKTSLFDLVDYESGDSWNGTHGRYIQCVLRDDGCVEVQSHNCMSSDMYSAVFTPQQIEEQIKGLSKAKYATDFKTRYSDIRRALSKHIPEVATAIKAEEDARVTVQQPVKLMRRIQLKP